MADQITQIEKRIKTAIENIRNGTTSPVLSGIGKLFAYLKGLDEASYGTLFAEYKPVFEEWKKQQKKLHRKSKKAAEEDIMPDIIES